MNNRNRKGEEKVHYTLSSIISIIIVIAISIIVTISLYKSKFFDWYNTKDLIISLSGGIIGCIGTIAAVMLTMYQTNNLQKDERIRERKRLSFENMPVFVVGSYDKFTPLTPTSRIETRDNKTTKYQGVLCDFIIKNISNHQALLSNYSIRIFYCDKSLTSLYPGEKGGHMIDINLRKSEIKEIGYGGFNYNGSLISANEEIKITEEVNTKIDIFDILNNGDIKDKGDIYADICINYRNMLGQTYKQELKVICSIAMSRTIFTGENIPSVIDFDV